MKKIIIFSLIAFISKAQAQLGVGVVNPHSSAIFEASSSTMGALIPRMTTAQISAIASPAKGLMVMDTTVGCLKHYNGSAWLCEGDAGGDHDFYQITLPTTLTTTKPTALGNPAYRRGQTHFLSGTNVQDNNSYMNIRPEANRPYGLLVQNDVTNGALSSGTEQIGIYNAMYLSGSTPYTNTLRVGYNLLNQTGTANSSTLRVGGNRAALSGGAHNDVIGDFGVLDFTGGSLNTGRGIYGAITSSGTVTMSEPRAIEGQLNINSGALTLSGTGRAGLFQLSNGTNTTINHGAHLMGVDVSISNSGSMTATTAGMHHAGLWVSNNNNITGTKSISGGLNLGGFFSTYNAGIINAASGFGIYNQYYNDSTSTYTGEVTGDYTNVSNNIGNSMTSPTIRGGHMGLYNNGTMSSSNTTGLTIAIANQATGSSIIGTGEIAILNASINNTVGSTMTSPSFQAARNYIYNSGTINNSAGNMWGTYGSIYNQGTLTNSSSLRGGQFNIDNGVGASLTTTSALYGMLTQVNNNGTQIAPNIYGSLSQINQNAGTSTSTGEVASNYSNIGIAAGANMSAGNMYSTRSHINNSGTLNITGGSLMATNNWFQNSGTINTSNGGVFSYYTSSSNAAGATMNLGTGGLYNAYFDFNNYGTLTTGALYGLYSRAIIRDGATLNSNTLQGADINSQVYRTTWNRPAAGNQIGAYIHADGGGDATGPYSLNINSKKGVSVWCRRDGANSTETIAQEVGGEILVYHDALGTTNTTNSYAGIISLDHRGAGTITNGYGIYTNVGIQNTAVITNAYGIYLNDVQGNNTWGIFQGGSDNNYFSGNIGIGIPSPTYALQVSTNNVALPSSSTWQIFSDERLKNIKGKYDFGLKEILQLNPISFTYKNTDKKIFDTSILTNLSHGFSAQAVQQVFPDAVKKDADGYLNLNMHSINVAMVNAVKELNSKIEKVETTTDAKLIAEKLELMQAQIKLMKESNSVLLNKVQDYETFIKSCNLPCTNQFSNDPNLVARLYQNVPNPFMTDAKIEYFIPEIKTAAAMYFYDMTGRELSSTPVTQAGKGFINITAGTLAAGQYLYTLIVDGVEVGTKKMIITK